MPAREEIFIEVAGLMLRPVSISVNIGAGKAARAFSTKLAGTRAEVRGWLDAFRNSPPCRILANGSPVLTGHLEKYSPRFDENTYEMTVSGRSKTGDLVDSSHGHKKGEFLNKAPRAIIDEISGEHGVAIKGGGGARAREVFRLNPGETVFEAVERLARRDGFSFTDTEDGNLHLFDQPDENHAGQLIEGRDFASGSAAFDSSKRFRKTEVRGQASLDHEADNLQIQTEVEDENGARARRKIIVAPEFLRQQDAKRRAQHHRDRAAGRGITCEFSVARWRDAGGAFWAPRKLIYIESPSLGVAQMMMLESVVLKQGERDGTTADLSFVDPRAYGGKSGKGSKSGKAWSMKGAGDEEQQGAEDL